MDKRQRDAEKDLALANRLLCGSRGKRIADLPKSFFNRVYSVLVTILPHWIRRAQIAEHYLPVARSVAASLQEFCDGSLPYPEMVSEAARRAADKIGELREMLLRLEWSGNVYTCPICHVQELQSKGLHGPGCPLGKILGHLPDSLEEANPFGPGFQKVASGPCKGQE